MPRRTKNKKNNYEHATLDYDRITDNIFIGTNTCCQFHFEKELLDKGIEADISLEDNQVDSPFGVNFFIWLPTHDHLSPSQEQLSFGAETIKHLVGMKKKIYVHCRRGHGRAPTLVAAYLLSQEKTLDEALALIKKARPVTHINDEQMTELKKFEKTIKGINP